MSEFALQDIAQAVETAKVVKEQLLDNDVTYINGDVILDFDNFTVAYDDNDELVFHFDDEEVARDRELFDLPVREVSTLDETETSIAIIAQAVVMRNSLTGLKRLCIADYRIDPKTHKSHGALIALHVREA